MTDFAVLWNSVIAWLFMLPGDCSVVAVEWLDQRSFLLTNCRQHVVVMQTQLFSAWGYADSLKFTKLLRKKRVRVTCHEIHIKINHFRIKRGKCHLHCVARKVHFIFLRLGAFWDAVWNAHESACQQGKEVSVILFDFVVEYRNTSSMHLPETTLISVKIDSIVQHYCFPNFQSYFSVQCRYEFCWGKGQVYACLQLCIIFRTTKWPRSILRHTYQDMAIVVRVFLLF